MKVLHGLVLVTVVISMLALSMLWLVMQVAPPAGAHQAYLCVSNGLDAQCLVEVYVLDDMTWDYMLYTLDGGAQVNMSIVWHGEESHITVICVYSFGDETYIYRYVVYENTVFIDMLV